MHQLIQHFKTPPTLLLGLRHQEIMKTQIFVYLLFSLFLLSFGDQDACQTLNDQFSIPEIHNQLQSSTVRIVSPSENAVNSPECLCRLSACSSPQYALSGNDNETEITNVTVILESGVHVLNDGLTIDSGSFISFIGIENSVIQCGENPDIANCNLLNVHVARSSHVYFYGVTFQGCGSRISSVHVQYSDNIIFNNCVFKDNPSSAVHVYQADSVAFHSCHFEANIQEELVPSAAQYPNCYGGQNERIFFLDSRPTAGALSVYSYKNALKLLISETTFVNNSATPNPDKTLPRALLSFGHGGSMFIRLVNSSKSLICIQNSNFSKNVGEANGGAIQLSAAQDSSRNKIMIRNCVFTNNRCILPSCSGGVIGLDYFENSHENQIHIFNSSFSDNSAVAGGVVSLLTSVGTTPTEDLVKPLWLKDCTFEHNMAKEDGSVLSLFSVTLINELGFPAFIDNCRFERNIALDVNRLTAAVSAFRVSLTFDETNVFHNNFGGGLVLTESRANFNGSVAFEHNFAYNGGGIAMYGRCLLELYSGSSLSFRDNYALRRGGGMYVEYVSADFIFSILNRGCFIQYFSEIDQPPNEWNSEVSFTNNTAGEAGAAIYASDMSRCLWFGLDYSNENNDPIFVPVDGYNSPFTFEGNIVANNDQTEITEVALATDAVNMVISPELTNSDTEYSYSEKINFYLSTYDQFRNFREALWQVSALEEEELGAISTNKSLYSYTVPSLGDIANSTNTANDTDINLYFTVNSIASDVDPQTVNVPLSPKCHPGYNFSESLDTCTCRSRLNEIVRCDDQQRYFYVQEGLWVGSGDEFEDGPVFAPAIPGFLSCESEGNLPGCLYKFDDKDSQCDEGREGVLCLRCKEGYGLSFDLLSCHKGCSSWLGIVAFVVICIVVVILSFLVLYFDVRISNKLKGLIFYGQVIGVIYRNSPYINANDNIGDQILSFIVNLPGTSLPLPICFHENASGFAIAWLGIVPPSLALATAVIYIFIDQRLNIFQKTSRKRGLHGLHLITLFIYKYFVDAAFTFASVREINNQRIFSYSGEPGDTALAYVTLITGLLLIVIFGIIAPIVLLVYIYRPQNHRNFVDAFTRGLKKDKKYLWYSVWDIWRRLPFVAVNLLISVVSVSIIVLVHVLLVLLVMSVHCITKPYRRNAINVIETCVIFCLFGATLAILDENDIYIQQQIAITFILLPFIYGLLYGSYLFVKIIVRKFFKKEIKPITFVEHSVSTIRKLSHIPTAAPENDDHEEDESNHSSRENTDSNNQSSERKSSTGSWSSKAPPRLREPLLDTM